MIDLHFWPTPNGFKILIFLEESGLDYELKPVHIGRGEQFAPEFLAISPNNKMPAIVDNAPADGGAPISVFESGAILNYLAEKADAFAGDHPRQRIQVQEWLFWQVGGLGPMAGQNHHFSAYAPETIPYAVERYVNETARLYRVLNTRLEGREFLAGDYSVADMAAYPWVRSWKKQQQQISDHPALAAWKTRIETRPAVQRAYEIGKQVSDQPLMDDEAKRQLFGQR
ncbi:MAG: glutathione S-transferase N-terminal domain-containing protein [Pseudomonadota bacterium]